jgi:hypothetical protein
MNEILNQLWEKYPDLETCKEDLLLAFELMSKCYRAKGNFLSVEMEEAQKTVSTLSGN